MEYDCKKNFLYFCINMTLNIYTSAKSRDREPNYVNINIILGCVGFSLAQNDSLGGKYACKHDWFAHS